MGKTFISLLVINLALAGPLCYSQTSVKVSDPRLEFRDNRLLISYDILNSNPEEKYIISIDIRDQDGNSFKANTLEGDLGEIDQGDGGKQITWDLEADNVYINSYVYVKINARVIPPPEPVVIVTSEQPNEEVAQQEQEDLAGNQMEETSEAVTKKGAPADIEKVSYNRTGLILQSLAIPGLGLSRVTEKPHWLRGVAGYGCIAGSIILNRLAVNTFNTIEDCDNPDDASRAFDKSVQQDNVSEILVYAAVGIWVADIIWTIVGTSDLNRTLYSQTRGFSLRSNIDPLSNMPLVGFTYRF
jgi:hypothetical protein